MSRHHLRHRRRRRRACACTGGTRAPARPPTVPPAAVSEEQCAKSVNTKILGTSMTCSGIRKSKRASTATSWSTICGTGASRDLHLKSEFAKLLHGVPLDPLLCSLRLRQAGWLRPRWRSFLCPLANVRLVLLHTSLGTSTHCALWWRAVASASPTDIASCRWKSTKVALPAALSSAHDAFGHHRYG